MDASRKRRSHEIANFHYGPTADNYLIEEDEHDRATMSPVSREPAGQTFPAETQAMLATIAATLKGRGGETAALAEKLTDTSKSPEDQLAIAIALFQQLSLVKKSQ